MTPPRSVFERFRKWNTVVSLATLLALPPLPGADLCSVSFSVSVRLPAGAAVDVVSKLRRFPFKFVRRPTEAITTVRNGV